MIESNKHKERSRLSAQDSSKAHTLVLQGLTANKSDTDTKLFCNLERNCRKPNPDH